MKNADKMNKAAIWQWFISQTPPTYKRPRGKNAKERDEYSISYAAVVNGDRLIIGIWQGCKAKPLGVYYMTPGGSANTCTDGKNWHSGKLECIPSGGYSYWHCSYKYQWDMIYGKEEAIEYLKATFDEDEHPTFTWCTTVKDMVDRIETNIGFIKRRNARQRKEAKISAWANSMPPLPLDFDKWMHETVFSGVPSAYAFYLKTKNKYYCTACGKEHTAKDWKHLKTYTCSRTGKTVKVDKVQNSHSARERIMLVQSHYDIDGNICSVARHLSATAEWSISGYKQRAWSECIIPLPLDGGRVDASKIVYNHGGDKWSDKNVYGYQHKRCYCYPDVSALQGTLFGDIAIDAAAAKGWKLNYNTLMRGWYDDPRMEYLIKCNFRQLVDDITMFVMDYNAVLMPGNTIKDVLGIDGQGVNRLRDHNGGAYYVRWLRTAFMCGYKLPEETVQWFVKNKISPQDVAFALNCGMSPVQVANYLQKPHEYSDTRHYYVKSKVFALLYQWRDYINMAEKLKLDKHNPAVHKPKDLKARHDELVEILNAQRDEQEKERIESEYPNVKPVCDKIKAMYEWGDGIHEVVVPSGAAEIMREGRLLSHCVGSSDRYFDRIAAEESYVMFLRHSSDRDKPWYTLEVEPGGCIRQLRTIGDAEGEDRAEAKEFLTKWRKEISRRVGKAEQEAAIISREKRLAEFAELRRNGNVIRNGRLAGKLLVDVLEADFKEYNTEYVTA